MPKTPPQNLPTDRPLSKGTVLALTPNRRVTGAAFVDGVGVDRVWLLRLHGETPSASMTCKTKRWLDEILVCVQPETVVIEDLSSKRRTPKAVRLVRLLEIGSARLGFPRVVQHTRKRAIDWICRDERYASGSKRKRPTLRKAARLITCQCPELRFHPAPTCIYRTDWDRTWGQVAAAAALALFAKNTNK